MSWLSDFIKSLNHSVGISPRSLPLLDNWINNSLILLAVLLSYLVNNLIFIFLLSFLVN